MNPPRICVVIPTRERADTLRYALETCTSQKYPMLEILVCDNASQDGTRSVIDSVADKRVRYINPGRRLSMADNWDYALSQVTADYVSVIGDDDGLMPNAISDIANLLMLHELPAITWRKIEYCWPTYLTPELRGYMSVPLRNNLIRVRSAVALRHMYRFWMGYPKGPCIYNSIVSMQSIQAVRKRDGILFGSFSPDVYSSLAIASVTENYLLSMRPFSVNGASGHSNGASSNLTNVDREATKKFFAEYSEREPGFADVCGSSSAATMDSLLSFSARCPDIAPRPPIALAFRRIVAELSASPALLQENEALLAILAERHGCATVVRRHLARAKGRNASESIASPIGDRQAFDGDNLRLWCNSYGVTNVAQACNLAGRLLGPYEAPSRMGIYSVASVLYTRLARAAQNASAYIGI